MPDRLSLYNGALRVLGERKLASLTERRPPRFYLDDVWDADIVRKCLEQAMWGFATRTVELDYDAGITPDFGYQYAFEKPDDWVRMSAISYSEYFTEPLAEYADESGYIYADLTKVYARYVSDGEDYGYDFSLWTPSFETYVEHVMAEKVAYLITGSKSTAAEVTQAAKEVLRNAEGIDAAARPATRPSRGSWVGSRLGGRNDLRRR